MSARKFICVIFSIITILLCSCSNNTQLTESTPSSSDNTDAEHKQFSLLYSANDSLNPYLAVTQINRQISLLLYDPLVKMSPDFQPVFVLAKSVEINGKDCTVTLNNTSFSDTTVVSASDVVYSFELAKQSTVYSEQLLTVKSCEAVDDLTAKFKLTKSDPYFANLLDFPIIKKGSDKLQDENKAVLPPIGSGRYVINSADSTLSANNSHISGDVNINIINLINAPDNDVIKYNLEVNNVSIYGNDLRDGVIPPMSGSATITNLNNLIYVGINMDNPLLKSLEMRFALSYAINRTEICNSAYYGYATPAKGMFNSIWNDAGNLQNLNETSNLKNTVANLSQLGYNSKDTNGFLENEKGKTLSLELVAYKDNDRRLKTATLIKQQLEYVGIKVKLTSLDWDNYVSALSNGNFDLYVAETILTNNMDITELVTSNGSLSYGIPAPTVVTKPQNENNTADNTLPESTTVEMSSVPLLDSSIEGFYNETLSLVDIINAFNAELPILPICHRCGITVCDSSLNVLQPSSVSDIYFGISNITYK